MQEERSFFTWTVSFIGARNEAISSVRIFIILSLKSTRYYAFLVIKGLTFQPSIKEITELTETKLVARYFFIPEKSL